MSLVTDTIEAVVGSLTTTTTFIRTSKQEEANLILNTTDLNTDPIALYYNLPTVQGEPVAGRSVETHPVEIAFVDKAATADTTGVEDEVTRDAMRTSALEFYHSLVKNYTGIFEEFEGYEMEAVAMDKRFDVLMVGYSLKFDIKQLAGFGTVSVLSTLVNSEGTTINTLLPNQTKIQPDITVTQADNTTASHPSDKDLDVDDFQGAGLVIDWDWLVANKGRGYEYPQPTGQTTSYRTGDDPDIESTIFGATVRNAQTVKARNTLASWGTLNNNNSFGNTLRFTDEAGTEIFAAGLLVDNYTGLMWWDTLIANAIWNDQIDAALASSVGGYSDWFMANRNQVETIRTLDPTIATATLSEYFSLSGGTIWTSSERGAEAGTHMTYTQSVNAFVSSNVIATSYKAFLCRKHF